MEGVIVREAATDYLMDQAAPTRVDVEEQGPMRVTIVAEGVHRSGLAVDKLNYVARISRTWRATVCRRRRLPRRLRSLPNTSWLTRSTLTCRSISAAQTRA
jgi:hypothetical protein